jgi:uncharacterized protein
MIAVDEAARTNNAVKHKLEPLPNGFTRHQIAAAITPHAQELILLPTEKCNFRCTYCYEDFALGKMNETTQRAIELFIDRRVPNLKVLNFSWFGGEPLVAKEIVLRLSKYAARKCEEHGVKFSGGLTTNAYVLDTELAQELINLHQDFFQVTLDGWKEVHDVLRKRADGRGTFDTIWQNLIGLKSLKANFEVVVRVHVRRDNQENLETLMREYAKEFFDDSRFRLNFQHLRNLGGEGGKTVKKAVTVDELFAVEKKLREIVFADIKRLRNLSGSSNGVLGEVHTLSAEQEVDDSSIIVAVAENAGESAGSQRADDRGVGQPYVCYAAKPNSLLIRSNGRIGKCTVAFDDERNDIGYLDANGKIVINHEKLAPWYRGLETLDLAAVGCPIQGLAPATTPSPYPNKVILLRAV